MPGLWLPQCGSRHTVTAISPQLANTPCAHPPPVYNLPLFHLLDLPIFSLCSFLHWHSQGTAHISFHPCPAKQAFSIAFFPAFTLLGDVSTKTFRSLIPVPFQQQIFPLTAMDVHDVVFFPFSPFLLFHCMRIAQDQNKRVTLKSLKKTGLRKPSYILAGVNILILRKPSSKFFWKTPNHLWKTKCMIPAFFGEGLVKKEVGLQTYMLSSQEWEV